MIGRKLAEDKKLKVGDPLAARRAMPTRST